MCERELHKLRAVLRIDREDGLDNGGADTLSYERDECAVGAAHSVQ